MLLLAACLNLAAVLGLIFIALRYLVGPVPMDYHAAILQDAGEQAGPATFAILRALYRAFGSALLAVALAVAALTYFGTMNDVLWAKVSIVVVSLTVGALSTLAAYPVEQSTGVRTPWRSSLGLSAVAAIAFILSLL